MAGISSSPTCMNSMNIQQHATCNKKMTGFAIILALNLMTGGIFWMFISVV
ncbi:hypothetical protein ACJX0J_016830 [Zea mays]